MTAISLEDIIVDGEGYVFIGGQKVARRVFVAGELRLELVDKCRRRASERGSRLMYVDWGDFVDAIEKTLTNGT